MAEIASAYVSLLPSAKGFGNKLDGQISGDINSSGKKHGLSFGKLFAAGAALGIGAKAFSFLGDSIKEATDSAVVGSRTENVIKKMGNAANISANQVGALSTAISNKTAIDDEAIQSGANLLLTFGNVRNEAGKGNDIFNQTTKLMVDMSAAMGTDAKGAALQLGKALNDPTKGVTALARSGVSFTAQQKEQIKTLQESGKVLGAQKIILGEVSKQFGGAGAAMATPAEKASVAFGNLKEQIGTALLPTFNSLSEVISTKIVPAVSSFISGLQDGTGAGGRVADVLSTIKKNFDTIGPLVGVVAGGFVAYAAAMKVASIASTIMTAGTAGATGATWSLNTALRANPIGLVVTSLTLLGAGLVLAYKKSDTFRAVVDGAFSAIKKAGSALWDGGIKPAFDAMKKGFEAVGKAGTFLWNNALQPAFKFIVSGIASILDLWSSMLTTLGKVPGFGWAKDAAEAMGNAADKARGLADGIRKIPPTKRVDVTIAYKYTGLRGNTTRGSGGDISDSILPRLAPGQDAKSAFGKVLKTFGDAGKHLMAVVEAGIKAQTPKTVKAAQEAFGKLGDKLRSKRDDLKSTLDGFKSDFQSLVASVSGAFTGNLFDATSGADFISGLTAKKAELTKLLSSFATLKGWGLDPAFLSQLFASGNGAVAIDLASMDKGGALGAASLFSEVSSLGTSLGTSVAQNDPVASRIDVTNDKLDQVITALGYLGSDVGKELNSAAATAHRTRGSKKGRR